MVACSAVVTSAQRTGAQKCYSVRDNDRLGPLRSIKVENTPIFSRDGRNHSGNWAPSFFRYDRDGVLLEQFHYGDDGKISYHVTASRKGNRVRTVRRYMYDKVVTSVDTYDRCGNIINSLEYAADGQLTNSSQASYDRYGRHKGTVYLDTKGEMTGWAEISYDAAGRLVEELYRDAEGKPTARINRRYSIDNGASKEEVTVNHYSNPPTTFRFVTFIQKNGEQKKLYYGADGSLISRSTREYPNRDSHGNWIVEINTSWELSEGDKWIVKSKSKTTRTFTYY
jgi:hypothetical protein